jgi:hypothetical protein
MAARATFDLNTGVWFRRGRLLIVSPVRGHHRRYQAETPLIPLSRFAEPALVYMHPTSFSFTHSNGDGVRLAFTRMGHRVAPAVNAGRAVPLL